jgi:hypothetical protein
MNGGCYGVVGEFAAAHALRGAARHLYLEGIRYMDAYTPIPVEGLDDVLRPGSRSRVPLAIAAGALAGAALGYFVQYWTAAVDYPLNIGGRPYNSWPAFIVSAFELTLLAAVAAGFVAFFVFCRLPQLYHPIFAAACSERASRDRFLLCVEARDPHFNAAHIARVFEHHGAKSFAEVSQ